MLTKHLLFEQQGALPFLPMHILGMVLKRYKEHKHITLPKKELTRPGMLRNSIFCLTNYLVLFSITVLQPLTAWVGYLNFSTLFMWNMNIIWTKRDKIMKSRHFVGKRTQIVQHVLKNAIKYTCCLNIQTCFFSSSCMCIPHVGHQAV